MTTLRFPPQATTLAHALTLQPELWHRPQVEGITIDGPDSRDLDDAVWIEPTPSGAILSVHIADVSELVQIGSILDRVAIARTTTQYFKTGNVPMLPRALSEDKLSLWEYQDRPTLTIKITLNRNAEIEQTEIFESWLRSRRKFHYQEAEAVQRDPQDPFANLLQTAYAWAEQLYRDRLNAGAIGGTLTAQGDWLTEEGNLIQGKHYSSHLLIQEFMILANRAVAQWLAERDIPALYRNHTARAIAPDRETMYQTMLSLGSAQAISQRLASWLNRADYSPALIGHFALNLPAYCHFTSLIRRLADLINHRIVKARLRGQPPPYTIKELEQLGQHIAQVNRDIEQETADYFKEKHQQVYQAQVQDSEELSNTSEKEFSKLLKYAIEKQEMEVIAPELKVRLAARKLQLLDLYLLLFESEDKALQQEAYENLKENVQNAASIISMATAQQTDWDSFDYLDMQQSQTAPFYTWLEVKIKDSILTTVHPTEHQRKQPAHHQACLSWIESYLKNALVPPDQRVQPEPLEPKVQPQQQQTRAKAQQQSAANRNGAGASTEADPVLKHQILTKPLKDGQPFVSYLLEVTQGLRLPNPDFEFQQEEEGYFVCECRLDFKSQQFVGEATATKKQRAKHLAARAVLEQLQPD
ncbi:MAG: RNB domain-containing ribonuclease [Acaryochloridaceae cyanobacterium RU_4_10]|nr:RNB domain-containing ribonuclease [Acaryochloridaceae cyanobacterium RU_4_10]